MLPRWICSRIIKILKVKDINGKFNEIEDKLAYGEDWLKQERAEGFTVSAAESEGYVKALREVKETYIGFLKIMED